MGPPKISLSITPLHKKMLPNIMDIPFLSDFISKSINLAAQEYVAPKSMIFDLQTLLSSDGVKRGTAFNPYKTLRLNYIIDSASVGVIIVHIHRCKDLKSTDRRTGKGK
jgi:Ca2+-dependent lipid-binding protein